LGLAFGYKERRERLTIEKKLQSQMWSALERSSYVIGDHILLKEFHDELTHPEKYRLFNVHQAACDLYISLIKQYLSQVDSFTYDDLKKLCDNKAVHWKWQERQWRYLICRRSENVGVDVPEFFIKDSMRPYGNLERYEFGKQLATIKQQLLMDMGLETEGGTQAGSYNPRINTDPGQVGDVSPAQDSATPEE
jgi:hypothetical protein